MQLRIVIDLDNAAFEEWGAEEVARILASIAERIPDPLGETSGYLNCHDANGNHCGVAEITGEAVPDAHAMLGALRWFWSRSSSKMSPTESAKLVAGFLPVCKAAIGE